MKKPLALFALSGLILVGAAYPDFDKPDDEQGVASAEGGQQYRPCRSRRDDRCIQLYERGVRAAYARWVRDGDPGYDEAVRYAVYQDRADRPDRRRWHHGRSDADAGTPVLIRTAPERGHRANARLAMVDVLRCDDHAAARPVMRVRTQQIIRPAPRARTREDGEVRGM